MASPGPPDSATKNKQPSSSAFKQQKLPAWQPILTAGTVLPTFFIIGLAFIPIGIGLLVSSDQVQEYQEDYTFCKNMANTSLTCAETILSRTNTEIFTNPCTCKVYINITEAIKKDVYLYYGLTNYYQNHRRYVKSRDDRQLLGSESHMKEPADDCKPFQMDPETNLPIAPCGAIANSKFNDIISLEYVPINDLQKRVRVQLTDKSIAWPTDKNTKFHNPEPVDDLAKAFNGTKKPPAWQKPVYQLSMDNDNNGFKNEDLIVWMRTSALPTFRKLYRRIDHGVEMFRQGLPEGRYEATITYNYKVTPFKGTKRIILSNTSWLGGKNPFLGMAYIAVGSVCLILAVVFLVIHFKYGKSTQELVNISQRTPY